ncbi:MAG: 3-isopropylmalate dehydrogenase [Candidatus Wolfebacteria bacterium GW2011_GWC2_39_22]|uniref:3-isopropylmalate dehydrogenase n=2 Tax=Candidatus Wolfeibacteriota TaxID=1752735 RepID=A0A0G1H6Z4_9BACT|nr:MAG: 3-isopropylmalate dehydrogenase [Candidatus Wolfebacteria bacterium GW2011_GWC2_39_22]KKT42570.1 MAG: 3-isopropylmalate dehydrogenase [Candidatus Wolfebacteria bacterium GW2011_GWE2_44_13]
MRASLANNIGMKFTYTAIKQDGKMVSGEMEAQGAAQVLEFIASQGLRPVSLKKESAEQAASKARFLQSNITIGDKIFLTKYLALMLRIGTDLFKAIDILIADFDKPAVRVLLYEIRANLEKGQPFHVAFEKYPKYFTSVFVNLVKAGEQSGNLEKTFEQLSVNLQREQSLRQEVKSALTYPVILVGVASLVVLLLVSFALPKISKLFVDSATVPPLFSRIVFGIGLFLNQYIWIILILVIGGGMGAMFLVKNNDAVRKVFQHFMRRLPLIGPLLRKIAIQRFALTLSSLFQSGLPILEALAITADAVGDAELRDAINRIAKEGIEKGLTIGDAFKREPAFPKVVTNLVAISEKSGNLASILETLAEFYEAEIKTSVKVLVSFLEPVLLLTIGVVVGTIALAIIVPVYQLMGNF